MRTLIAVAAGTFVFSGCGTIQQMYPVEILTDPPGAAISINGAYLGDSPLTANIPARCVFVGYANAPDGYDCDWVRIHAEPKSTMKAVKLYSKTAIVKPGQMASNKVLMNLQLEPVQPTQPLEVR